MDASDITPLILTYNEEPNIGRCLARLTWARRVLVVDSGSTDATLEICASFPNVEVVHREFDSFAGQCNFGIQKINTSWVLSLDADYLIPVDFAERAEVLTECAAGFRTPFRYCVFEAPLRTCLYPARTVLYRPGLARYEDDGHGHKVRIDGTVLPLGLAIDHDDRKPLSRWLRNQSKYAESEADKLLEESDRDGWADRLRRMIWPAAPAVFMYTLFVKRLLLDGWPGFFYVLQRTYAELLLSLELLERRLNADRQDGWAVPESTHPALPPQSEQTPREQATLDLSKLQS